MRQILEQLSICILLLLVSPYTMQARTCSAVNTGNWNSPATWSCGSVPTSNDTLTIPDGRTVYVDCNCGLYSNMLIHLYGTFYFNNGQKIDMSCNSKVIIYPGGTIAGDNAGSKVVICGNDVYNGGMGPVSGPAQVDQYGTYSTLPIELLSFNVNVNRNNQAEISWTTATETNNDYFTIERTTDGVNYEVVEVIDGAGTSIATREYYTIDPFPLPGTSYYRLKQTDLNGHYEYSDLVAVSNNDNVLTALKVYPNPSDGGKMQVDLDGQEDEEILVVVKDLLGQEYYSKVVIMNSGKYKLVVDPSQKLAPGLYLVVASSHNNMLYSQRVIVK